MQAKRDRKTLDFTSVLTETHHKVNVAVLWNLLRQGYICCTEEVHLYMAIPGKFLLIHGGPLPVIIATTEGRVYILHAQTSVHMHAHARVCFQCFSTLASKSLSSSSCTTQLEILRTPGGLPCSSERSVIDNKLRPLSIS